MESETTVDSCSSKTLFLNFLVVVDHTPRIWARNLEDSRNVSHMAKLMTTIIEFLCDIMIYSYFSFSCWLSVEQGTIFGFVAPMLVVILVRICQILHKIILVNHY